MDYNNWADKFEHEVETTVNMWGQWKRYRPFKN